MRVGLIACSGPKLERRAPARELYTGELFRLSRAWIERRETTGGWAVLSAKHGVVLPTDELDPYDVCLNTMPAAERRAWADRTRQQIIDRWGRGAIYQVILPGHYLSAVLGLPYLEDVITHWTQQRRDAGTRPAHMGIGVLRKYLIENRGFY